VDGLASGERERSFEREGEEGREKIIQKDSVCDGESSYTKICLEIYSIFSID
jgi:hypothetical protein